METGNKPVQVLEKRAPDREIATVKPPKDT